MSHAALVSSCHKICGAASVAASACADVSVSTAVVGAAVVFGGTVVLTSLNRMAIASLTNLVFVHAVAKWLHHVLLKYVMLWQAAVASHDVWHASRLATFPDG